MILLLDLGNTRIKWALSENGDFSTRGAVEDPASLAEAWASVAEPEQVLGCAVGSPGQQEQVAALVRKSWRREVQWLKPLACQAGVRNSYTDPSRLGADRWAALLGARARFPGLPLVVVSAGTALVVDALSEDGIFLGGMILPGYRMMKSALASNTARLPLAEGRFVSFPTTTDDAIETGCLSALAGAIAGMTARLSTRENRSVRVLLSGGDAERLLPLLDCGATVVDNLALYGLAAWAGSA